MSTKIEITRYHGGDEIRTIVSKSGMVRTKHSFKGYDGNQCVRWPSCVVMRPTDDLLLLQVRLEGAGGRVGAARLQGRQGKDQGDARQGVPARVLSTAMYSVDKRRSAPPVHERDQHDEG